jgi:hypothetical protein
MQVRLFAKRAFTPLAMMILSRYSERIDRTYLSACEFAFGAFTGVQIIFIVLASYVIRQLFGQATRRVW